MKKFKSFLFLCIFPFAFCGCASFGAHSLKSNKSAYIEALSQSNKQEMLANIVRAKYSDPPVFLKINTITASPSVDMGIGSEDKLGDTENYLMITPSFHYKESPTILYTPMMGSEYSTQLLMPMNLTNLFLMVNNGFRMETVADLMVKTINDKVNNRTASNGERQEFKSVVRAIDRLMDQKLLVFGTPQNSVDNVGFTLLAHVKEEAFATDDYKLLVKELNLDNNAQTITLKLGYDKNTQTMAITTRSFLATLNYLANFVDVPVKHQNLVWKDFIDTQDAPIHIYCSSSSPNDASCAVSLHGYWFYVKNDDIKSQSILYLLQILYDIQARIGKDEGQIQLSLPVK